MSDGDTQGHGAGVRCGHVYKATVEVTGSIAVWLTDVPVSRNIASGDLVAGRSVAVVFFDDANPDDAVLTAVWA